MLFPVKITKCSILFLKWYTTCLKYNLYMYKDEIRNALGHICHKLGKLHHRCEKMVNEHSDQIVDLITKHTPPGMICKIIGMCKSASQDNCKY